MTVCGYFLRVSRVWLKANKCKVLTDLVVEKAVEKFKQEIRQSCPISMTKDRAALRGPDLAGQEERFYHIKLKISSKAHFHELFEEIFMSRKCPVLSRRNPFHGLSSLNHHNFIGR